MTEIRITSIPLIQMLLESIEITVLSLQLQKVIENDQKTKEAISHKINDYDQLAGHFKTILENIQKND